MGGELWMYFVPYQKDFQQAMEELREQEFEAERYYPVNDANFQEYFDEKPVSIEEAREMADADGTRSILDIDRVGDEADYGVVRRLTEKEIVVYFGTKEPTRDAVEANSDFFEDIERGQGVCFVVYQDGAPSELVFAGYSYD